MDKCTWLMVSVLVVFSISVPFIKGADISLKENLAAKCSVENAPSICRSVQ